MTGPPCPFNVNYVGHAGSCSKKTVDYLHQCSSLGDIIWYTISILCHVKFEISLWSTVILSTVPSPANCARASSVGTHLEPQTISSYWSWREPSMTHGIMTYHPCAISSHLLSFLWPIYQRHSIHSIWAATAYTLSDMEIVGISYMQHSRCRRSPLYHYKCWTPGPFFNINSLPWCGYLFFQVPVCPPSQ